MSDPRTRKGRHLLTFENLASSLQMSGIPSDWTQDTVTSVIAGAGPVVNIAARLDPRTSKLSSIEVDFTSSKACKRAFELLLKIENLPCSIDRIIPKNFDELKTKSELTLDRGNFPWDSGLELPFEMILEVPLSRKPAVTQTKPKNQNIVAIPDILSKASQHLPALNPSLLSASDQVSANLSKISPLQLIEMISNLKILANQDISKKPQLEQFLSTNADISISVAQVLLEMGFIDSNVVSRVLKGRTQTSFVPHPMPNAMSNTMPNAMPNLMPNQISSSMPNSMPNLMPNSMLSPMSNSMPMPMPMPMPISQQTKNMQPPPFGFMPPAPMPFMPAQAQSQSACSTINYAKLDALPQDQRNMIKQVLGLNPNQIQSLPDDQKQILENLRKEYLL